MFQFEAASPGEIVPDCPRSSLAVYGSHDGNGNENSDARSMPAKTLAMLRASRIDYESVALPLSYPGVRS